MQSVYLNGKQLRLQPDMVIGKGGEADIYKLNQKSVLKLYKRPNDPDYSGNIGAQVGAKARLDEQQRKLPAFPKGLPPQVVAPTDLAYNKSGDHLVGYVMPFVTDMEVLLQLGNRRYRETGGIDGNQVVGIFRELHTVVKNLHAQHVVIGDFNDLNVMASDKKVQIVDADSMQFAGYNCHTFTNRFVDPLCCDQKVLSLVRPHNEGSDWYAYFIMLLQSLLYVGPYGGVHRPASGKRLQHDGRVLQRLTVLGSDIVYPKPALPLDTLPDELIGYMKSVFEDDVREPFPGNYIDGLRFTTCRQCGHTHARRICPGCALPGVPKQVITVRGTVTAKQVFRTNGRLLHVVNQAGILRYLYYDKGAFYREDGRQLLTGDLDPGLRFRIQEKSTVIGKQGALFTLDGTGVSQRSSTDVYHQKLPVFDTNDRHSFWVSGDQLVRSDRLGPSYIGDVLSGQTLFWTGSYRGFGFYQAGQILRSFMFDTQQRGINDQVGVASFAGQLVDATCVFSDTYTWFMLTYQDRGTLCHRVTVIDSDGQILAEQMAEHGDDSWLGYGIRGHMAVGSSLYVATDDGIVRVGIDNGQIVKERSFPDTEPFVDSNAQLIGAPGGIYVVSTREITLLEIR